MKKILFTAIAAASLLGAGAPAHANPGRIIVRHADLDLADAAGVAQFDRCIRVAAGRVCAKMANERLLTEMAETSDIEKGKLRVHGKAPMN